MEVEGRGGGFRKSLVIFSEGGAHHGLAVLVEGVLDKHGSQREAQGAVRVADAHLPARGAALRANKRKTR